MDSMERIEPYSGRPRSQSADRALRRTIASEGGVVLQHGLFVATGTPGRRGRSESPQFPYRSPSVKGSHPLISSSSIYGDGLRMTSASPRSASASRSRSLSNNQLPNQETFDRLYEDAVIYKSKLAVKRNYYEQQRLYSIQNEQFRKPTFSNPGSPRTSSASSFATGFGSSPRSPPDSNAFATVRGSFGGNLDSPRSSRSPAATARRYSTKEEAYTALHLGLSPKTNDKYRDKIRQIELDSVVDLTFRPKLVAPKSAQMVIKHRAEKDQQIKMHLNIDITEYTESTSPKLYSRSPSTNITSTNNSPYKRPSNMLSMKDMSSPDMQQRSPEPQIIYSSASNRSSPGQAPSSGFWNVISQYATGTEEKEPINKSGSNSVAQLHDGALGSSSNNSSNIFGGSGVQDVASEIDVSNQKNVNNSRMGGVIVSNSTVYQHSVANDYYNLKLSQKNKQHEKSAADLDLSHASTSSPKGRSKQTLSISTNTISSPPNLGGAYSNSSPAGSNPNLFTYRPLGPGGAFTKSPKATGEIIQGRI